ncbi:MAG: ABC transporter ATP-binding protein [Planctomycetota bacterium]|jgi:iron complex transport system ATP-binding protein
MSIIKVSHLDFSYSQGQVLRDLSFQVERASFLAIVGPNGAGKSTLLNLLNGQFKATSGSVEIEGAKVQSYCSASLAKKVAVVRQEFVPVFGFSVLETVLMARVPYYNRSGFESKRDRDIANDALDATDTLDLAGRQLSQISGGERQRVFIARALAQDTPVLLLDEPTSFLDLRHQVRIYDLLKKMQTEKDKTIVAVTHDINLAAQYCDEVLLLGTDGNYYQCPGRDAFVPEKIEKIFGVTGFSGQIGKEKFFLPLGKFAKDCCNKEE